jgi:hypothetical protein
MVAAFGSRVTLPGRRVLPDFIICGAQQSGTSFLYQTLARHRQVARAARKEIHYFDYNYASGPDWYRSHFPTVGAQRLAACLCRGRRITGEASPYYLFYPHAARRAHQLVPAVRLIILLRNPVDRAYLHYRHEVARGREMLPFDQAIDQEPERLAGELEQILENADYASANHRHFSYVSRGIYVDQISRWLDEFDRGQLLVLQTEEMLTNLAVTLDRICHFLGIAPFKRPPRPDRVPRRRDIPIDVPWRRRLHELFRPHNQRLADLLGSHFRWNP